MLPFRQNWAASMPSPFLLHRPCLVMQVSPRLAFWPVTVCQSGCKPFVRSTSPLPLQRVSALAADSAVPVILCGDLNCSPDSDVCAALRTDALGLSDAFAEPAASTSGLHGSTECSAKEGGGNGRAGSSGYRPFTTWKFR